MKKTICCVGSSGFIGNQIYKKLKKLNKFEIYRFSSKKNKFIDKCKIEKFDILIFSAGIHAESDNDDKNIFYETKKIFRKTSNLFINSNNIIFISSFKTCFDIEKKIIKSDNNYNYYKYDNYYGKSKLIFEKLFVKVSSKLNKKYKIICPSHVIGPEDYNNSSNGNFFKYILKKKIIFYPSCFISIIDVRNLSQIIIDIILKNDFDNSKIIANDKSILLEQYIEDIKLKENYVKLKVNFNLIKLVYFINKFLIKVKIMNKNFISKNRVKYIEMKAKTEVSYPTKKIEYKKTISDTRNFFLNR